MKRANVKVTKKNNKTNVKVQGMLYNALIILVVFLAFMVYFVRLPETGAYFYHQVDSQTYKVEIEP